MKVLLEARESSTNHSLFVIPAYFRSMLAAFGMDDLSMKAYKGDSNFGVLYTGEEGQIRNGYRIAHISEMGSTNWNRRFFNIGVDESNNIITQKANTTGHISYSKPEHKLDEQQTWDLTDKETLKKLFAEIQKETTYEHTFGYDLVCAASFCAVGLLALSQELEHNLIFGAIAVLLSVIIYAAVIPPALTSIAMEELICKPLESIFSETLQEKNEEFINQVTGMGLN